MTQSKWNHKVTNEYEKFRQQRSRPNDVHPPSPPPKKIFLQGTTKNLGQNGRFLVQ